VKLREIAELPLLVLIAVAVLVVAVALATVAVLNLLWQAVAKLLRGEKRSRRI
jgi:hypothetical protein